MNKSTTCPTCGTSFAGTRCPRCMPGAGRKWPLVVVLAVVAVAAIFGMRALIYRHHPAPHPTLPTATPATADKPSPSATPLPGGHSIPDAAASSPFDALTAPPDVATPPAKMPASKPVVRTSQDIFTAVKHQDVAAVRQILETRPEQAKAHNYKGATGLQLAATLGNVEMVKLFLAHGAEVNAGCNLYLYAGQTALHLAAGQGHVAVVEQLLAHGANINARDLTRSTPLHEAAIQGRNSVITALLKHHAILDARQKEGYSPLCWAVINGHLDTVELLIAHGANINAQADDGTTPTKFADLLRQTEIAIYLRSHGGE